MTNSPFVMQLTPDEKTQAVRAILDRHRGKDLADIMAGLHMELLEKLVALEQRVSALEERKKR